MVGRVIKSKVGKSSAKGAPVKGGPQPAGWAAPPADLWLQAREAAGAGSTARSRDDAVQHILQRRLPMRVSEDHFRYVELVAGSLIGELRALRDLYRQFLQVRAGRSQTEIHWRVLRFGVLEVALHLLRDAVTEYVTSSHILRAEWDELFATASVTKSWDSEATVAKEGGFVQAGPALQTCLIALLPEQIFD